MKHKILILILALFLITPAVTAEEWWNTDWQYRKEVNLSNIENIGRVDDTIIITDIQEKFPLAQEDFGDLRVVESENEIAYELFDNKGRVQKNKKVEYLDLNEIIAEKRPDFNENEVNSIVSFLKYLLN